MTNGGTLGAAANGNLKQTAVLTAAGGGLNGTVGLSQPTVAAHIELGSGTATTAGPVLLTGGNWTATVWFKNLYTTTDWRTLLRAGSNNGLHEVIIENGSRRLGVYEGGFQPSGYSVPASFETDGLWHQIAAVGSGTGAASTTTLFIDGVQVGVVVGHNNGTDVLALGGYQGNSQAFAKTIDEAYIYQSSLTPAQIYASYLNGAATAPSDPIPNGSTVTVAGSGTLDLNGLTETIGALSGSGSVTNSNAHSAVLITGASNIDSNFSGVISDGLSPVNVTKTGSGTQTFSGVNTYTGNTSITGGVLSVSADNNLGAVPAAAVRNLFIGGGTLLAASSFTLSANRSIGLGDSSATSVGTIQVGPGILLTYGGVLSNNIGTGALNITGGGTVSLTGTVSSFTGGVTIAGTTLAFSANSANDTSIPALGTGTKAVNVSGGATIRPIGTFTPAINTKNFIFGAGGGTFDMPNGSSFNLAQANQLQGAGVITVTGTGTGTFYAGGNNTNSGGVVLNSGTLGFSGSNTAATTWATGQLRALGLIIVPTTGNGYYYEVMSSVTSGATQPTWPTTPGTTFTGADGVTYAVRLSPSGPIGTGSLTINGGALRTDATARTINNPVNINVDLTFGVASGGNSLTLNSSLAPTAAQIIYGYTGARTITVNTNGLALIGLISGAGTNTLTKAGTGDLTLSDSTTTANMIGDVTVSAGRLFITATVAAQANLQATMGPGTYTIASGGTLDFNTNTAYSIPNPIIVQSGGNIANRQNVVTLTGPVTLPTSGTIYFNQDDSGTSTLILNNATNAIAATSDLTFQVGTDGFGTGPFAGTGAAVTTTAGSAGTVSLNHLITNATTAIGLIKTGPGGLILTNAGNTFGGAGKAININNGTFGSNSDAALGDAANVVNFNGGSRTTALSFTGTGAENTLNKQLGQSASNANFAVLFEGSFTAPTSGTYTFGLAADDGAVLYLDANQNGTFESSERVVSLATGTAGTAAGTTGTVAGLIAGQTYSVAIGFRGGATSNNFEARYEPGTAHTTEATITSTGIINPSDPGQVGVWSSVYGPNTLEQRVYAYPNVPTQSFIDPLDTFPGLLTGGPVAVSRFQATAGFSTSRPFNLGTQAGIDVTTGTLTLAGLISDLYSFSAGNGGLTKTNTGGNVLITNNSNTYTGPNVLRGGLMQVNTLGNAGTGGTPSALGTSSNAATNLIIDGGFLSYNGTVPASTDRNFTLTTNGGGFDNSSAAAANTLTIATTVAPLLLSPTNIARTLTLQGANTGANIFNPQLVDAGTPAAGWTALAKSGNGLWVLTNDSNSYTGMTNVNAGTLRVPSANVLGSTLGGTIISSGGTVELNGSYTLSGENFFLAGAGTAATVGAINTVGTITVPGMLEVPAGSNASIGATTGSTLTITGATQLNGGNALSYVGAGNINDTANVGNLTDYFTVTPFSARVYTGTGNGIDFTTPANINAGFNGNSITGTLLSSVTYNGALNFPANAAGSFNTVFGTGTSIADNFSTIWSTTLTITKPGIYTFANTNNDDGATLWLHAAGIASSASPFIASDKLLGLLANGNTTSAAVTLTPGQYTLIYTLYDVTGGEGFLGRIGGPQWANTPVGTNLPIITSVAPATASVVANMSATGTVSMQALNTYAGLTTLSGGTLAVASPASLGSTTSPLVITAGSLQLTNQTFSSKPITIAGSGLATVGAISAVGNVNVSSPMNLEYGNASIGAALATTNLTLSGPIKSDYDTGFTLTGAGNVNVTGAISNSMTDYSLSPFTARLYTSNGTGNILFDSTAQGLANMNNALAGASSISVSATVNGNLTSTISYNGALNFPTPAAPLWNSLFGTFVGDNFSDIWITTLTVNTPGVYAFSNTNNDDGASLWLHTGAATAGPFTAGDKLLGVVAGSNTTTATATLAVGVNTLVYTHVDNTGPEAFIGRIASPSTISSAAGAITNNGTTFPIAGSTGTLNVNMPGGTATFSNAANSYKNATAVSAGTLVNGAAGAIPSTTALILGNGTTNAVNLNLSTFSQTVASLTINSNTASADVINIAAGTSLTVTGNVQIGSNIGTNDITNAVFTGGGTFNMNAPTSTFSVGNPYVGTLHAVAANADMTGLSTALITAATVRIGDNDSNVAAGTALGVGGNTPSLPTAGGAAASATITAATLSIGGEASTNVDTVGNVFQTLNLGSGTNIINANTINIGANSSMANTIRGNGVLTWSPAVTTGTLTVANQAGSGGATLNMINSGSNATNTSVAIFDTGTHSAILSFGAITMSARSSTQGTAAGGASSTFSFNLGSLTAASLAMTNRSVTNSGGLASTMNLGGGTVSFGSITMARNTTAAVNATAETATLNINGSTNVTVTAGLGTGNLVMSSTTGNNAATSTINVGNTATLSIAGTANMASQAGVQTATATINASGNAIVSIAGAVTMSTTTVATGVATSSINVTGSAAIATGALSMGTASAGTGNATISIPSGTLTVNGPLSVNTSAGTMNRSLSLTGGILDMTGNAVGATGLNIPATITAGTMKNLGDVNPGTGIVKTTTGTLNLPTANPNMTTPVSVTAGILDISNSTGARRHRVRHHHRLRARPCSSTAASRFRPARPLP